MNTIVVPTELVSNRKLFAVPQRAYEDFLAWERASKAVQTFTPTVAERRALARARRNRAVGKFFTLTELRHAVEPDR